MKKLALSLFLFFVLSAPAKSVFAATSSILIDAKSGNVLYSENADILRYPASLTKLMTLYITFNALENGHLKLDDNLKISYTAANRSPSRLGLIAGNTIDVRTAILGTIIKSANDCATVLGEALAKDERSFAKLMTKTAQQLGMKDTTFKNASGLPNSQQKTTARDMAVLAAAIYHHFPQYYAWFSVPAFEYQGQTYQTHNFLLKDFDGADGLKTGYTAASGFNIVTSARRGSHRVIAVTMGHDRQEDRDKKVAVMMDKALAEMEKTSKIDTLQLRAEIDKLTPTQQNIRSASVARKTDKGKWAVQIGAFNSYDKAQNHAKAIQKMLTGNMVSANVHIERVVKDGHAVYRSKLAGLSKTDASKACKTLHGKKQSCVVTDFHPSTAYAQR